MIRIALACLMLLGLAACNQDWPLSAQDSTVLIKDKDGTGSGVIIGPRTILTAAHVVRDAEDAKVQVFFEGRKEPIEGQVITLSHSSYDVAIVRLAEDAPNKAMQVVCRNPDLGEELMAIGHPLGGGKSMTWGKVSSKHQHKYYHWVPVDMHLIRGMSGGPVLDKEGNVVGLVSAMQLDALPVGFMYFPITTGIGFIVGGQDICTVLGK